MTNQIVRMGALNSFELLTLVNLLLMKCNGGNLIRLEGYISNRRLGGYLS